MKYYMLNYKIVDYATQRGIQPYYSHYNLDNDEVPFQPSFVLSQTNDDLKLPSCFLTTVQPHPELVDVHLSPKTSVDPKCPHVEFLIHLTPKARILIFIHLIYIIHRLDAKIQTMIDRILNHAKCSAEWRHSREYFPDESFRHLAVTLTWRVIHIQPRTLTRYEQTFHEFQLAINEYQFTQTPNPTHPYQYQCRTRYDNVQLPCPNHLLPKPYDSQIILRPITSTPLRLRHYDALWNNLTARPSSTNVAIRNRGAKIAKAFYSIEERQVRCLHQKNKNLEHYDAPFNKLHQLL